MIEGVIIVLLVIAFIGMILNYNMGSKLGTNMMLFGFIGVMLTSKYMDSNDEKEK